MTAGQALVHLTARLAPLGESAPREARFLLEHILAGEIHGRYDERAVTRCQLHRLEAQAIRRLEGEPLQYILGEWEFFSLPFLVGPGVLVPRPDTERLVERALDYLKRNPMARVADLCSGSGAVAVAIAHEAPQCEVVAVEWDETAFSYLERNVALNRVDNVTTVRADVLTGPQELGPFELIVSNPPYIPSDAIERLDSSVRREPQIALDGGADGLTFYRAILSQWLSALSPEGALMVEIGFDQRKAVSELFAACFARVECLRDYGGNDRVIVGTHRR